ncbi:MAG: 30S ribosomal protein S2 [Candidatus Aenigmarchaeota archaeon]|nr:30S ribosomal protein S2 [Candidatus Aenigmarchaeota archaeon]
MQEDLLIPRADYLSAGVHIGMRQRTEDMREFIFKIRSDGMSVLDIKKLDERIRIASKFLASKNNILVVSRRGVGGKAAEKFAELVGGRAITGRFYPGTLTNPAYEGFFQPGVVLVMDPLVDAQAVTEAVDERIPVIALCDTFNETRNLDLVLPTNNKGKRAIALIFWLLTRETMKAKDLIKSDGEYASMIVEKVKTETPGLKPDAVIDGVSYFEGVESYEDKAQEERKNERKEKPKRKQTRR